MGLPLRGGDLAAAAKPALVGANARSGRAHHALQAAADLHLLGRVLADYICSRRATGDLRGIHSRAPVRTGHANLRSMGVGPDQGPADRHLPWGSAGDRSEEHTSE